MSIHMTVRRLALIPLFTVIAAAEPSPYSGIDIAWKVLPRRVVADSFGSRVAKLYFAVVAVVGNSSGNDIQVSSILFQLPPAAGLTTPIPADPYRIVRGSLERENQVGIRNTAINTIKALSPVLGGAAVFYSGASAASINHGVHYSRIVDLFTNPFEKGIELAFPDKTIHQMSALDNQAMRDTSVISNHSQQVLMVFVSRDTLMPPRDGSAATEAKRRLLRSRFKAEFDPLLVMHELGELVLVGKSISYGPRVIVTK